jgi:hypothetical protein
MNTHQKRPSRLTNGSHSGLTLIEVVAGTVLAGTLLVGILLAMTSHGRQLRQLKLGQAGLELLDRFLANWAQRDFSDSSLTELAKSATAPIVVNNSSISGSPASPSDLWIRITTQRQPELQIWKLERVQIEAVSQRLGNVVAKLEIVRYVP